jgi:hypothetical protein
MIISLLVFPLQYPLTLRYLESMLEIIRSMGAVAVGAVAVFKVCALRTLA